MVLASGMRLEPTGRNPRHYTLGFDDLEDGVRQLACYAHLVVPNVYHDAYLDDGGTRWRRVSTW
jgi:hypothetical protein